MTLPIESEFRRHWPAVMTCFWAAVFSCGFCFHGQAVYLAALREATGWPTSLIFGATTLCYLAGAGFAVFVPQWIACGGPRAIPGGGVHKEWDDVEKETHQPSQGHNHQPELSPTGEGWVPVSFARSGDPSFNRCPDQKAGGLSPPATHSRQTVSRQTVKFRDVAMQHALALFIVHV